MPEYLEMPHDPYTYRFTDLLEAEESAVQYVDSKFSVLRQFGWPIISQNYRII